MISSLGYKKNIRVFAVESSVGAYKKQQQLSNNILRMGSDQPLEAISLYSEVFE